MTLEQTGASVRFRVGVGLGPLVLGHIEPGTFWSWDTLIPRHILFASFMSTYIFSSHITSPNSPVTQSLSTLLLQFLHVASGDTIQLRGFKSASLSTDFLCSPYGARQKWSDFFTGWCVRGMIALKCKHVSDWCDCGRNVWHYSVGVRVYSFLSFICLFFEYVLSQCKLFVLVLLHNQSYSYSSHTVLIQLCRFRSDALITIIHSRVRAYIYTVVLHTWI